MQSSESKNTAFKARLMTPLNLSMLINSFLLTVILLAVFFIYKSISKSFNDYSNTYVYATHLFESIKRKNYQVRDAVFMISNVNDRESLNYYFIRLNKIEADNFYYHGKMFEEKLERLHGFEVADPELFAVDDLLDNLPEDHPLRVKIAPHSNKEKQEEMRAEDMIAKIDSFSLVFSEGELNDLLVLAQDRVSMKDLMHRVDQANKSSFIYARQTLTAALERIDKKSVYDESRQIILNDINALKESIWGVIGNDMRRIIDLKDRLVLADASSQVRANKHRLERYLNRVKNRYVDRLSKDQYKSIENLQELLEIHAIRMTTYLDFSFRMDNTIQEFLHESDTVLARLSVITNVLDDEEVLAAQEAVHTSYYNSVFVTVLGLLAIVISLWLGWLTRKLIVDPMYLISSMAVKVANGELKTSEDLEKISNRQDEVGLLALSICNMTQSLAQKNHALLAQQQALHHMAYHDSLTKLPNRAYFVENLEKSIKTSSTNHDLSAVLFIDLDGFKDVNDTLGHSAGDKLLLVISSRLQRCCRTGDEFRQSSARQPEAKNASENILARLGGDEFTVVLNGLTEIAQAGKIAERIIQTVAEPITIGKQQVNVTASVGIAMYPNDGVNSESLMVNADVAMYASKERGKNQYVYFSSM